MFIPLSKNKHKLYINNIRFNNINGGSFQIIISKEKKQSKKTNKLIFYETFKLFVKVIFIFIIFIFYLKFNYKIYLFSIIHPLSLLFLLNFVNKDI